MPDDLSSDSIVIVPGSRRVGSLNLALSHRIARIARDMGHETAVLDLDAYVMPIYDGDLEQTAGVPEGASRLHDEMVGASVIIFVSPEYNGGPTPLLKNAIDWVTRASKRPLEHKRVALASATPGSGGGRTVLAVMEMIMGSLRADVSDDTLSVGRARHRLEASDASLDDDIERFLRSLDLQTRTPASERLEPASARGHAPSD